MKRRKTRVKPRFWLILTLPVLACFLLLFINRSAQIRTLQASISVKQQQINEAALRKMELERKLAFIQTDSYVQQEARRRFGYLKPGEIRFMVGQTNQINGVVEGWQQERQALTNETDLPFIGN
ncbi:MAG: septum formation initiator family protein [Clostridia bacterium]